MIIKRICLNIEFALLNICFLFIGDLDIDKLARQTTKYYVSGEQQVNNILCMSKILHVITILLTVITYPVYT